MRVLLLGATGLIGTAVADALAEAGHAVTGLARQAGAAAAARPHLAWIARDLAACTTPRDWMPLLAGIDAVVNCAGVLQDGPRDDVRAVQEQAMLALWQACAAAGARRVVQVSAVGAEPDAPTLFMRSKAAADAALAGTALDWVVLRPGLVWAPNAYGGTALLRALAAWPGVLPLPLPLAAARLQTVAVDDVAAAVVAALDGGVPARRAYDLVEEPRRGLAEVVAALRGWSGRPPLRIIPAPGWVAGLAGWVSDRLGWLGWRSPLRSTAIAELARGVCGDSGPWEAATGRPLATLDQTLRRHPATVQDRWFGRAWLLRPLLIGGLALFWLASGTIALARPDEAAAVLSARGMTDGLALALVLGGAVLDVALGALVLVKRTMPFAALGMLAASVAYLAGGTLLAPDLWADPLGPLVKALPAMLPAATLLALAEER